MSQYKFNTAILVIRTEEVFELSEITLRTWDNSVICFGRSPRYSYKLKSINYSTNKYNKCKHTNFCAARKFTNKLSISALLHWIEILKAVSLFYNING